MVSIQKESEIKSNINIPVFKSSSTNIRQTLGTGKCKPQLITKTNHCFKCFIAKRLWMFSVNIYDLMGLLDICPCATLHSTQPYITYRLKN